MRPKLAARTKLLRTAILLGCFVGPLSGLAAAQDDEVWQMEKAYWQYVQAGDVEKYVTLWHEDFVGWPCSRLQPSRKVNIGDWVRRIRDEGIKVTYGLRREAVQYFGEVAVVHYATVLVYEFPDGRITGEGQDLKFTHTWMKADSRWQIIGGMCAELKPTTR